MDWFEQAMNDIGNAVEDAVEWVEDAVEDVGEWVEEAVENVGEAVDEFVEGVGELAEGAGEIIEDVVEGNFEEAAQGFADWTMDAVDTFVFDPVNFVTAGTVDIDLEDGQLTAGVNLGIASAGISVGEQGFDAHAGFDIGIASGDISIDSDAGLAMSGTLGVDWGPLPYAEGHLEIGTDGEVSIGGHVQATLPLPGGSIGGMMGGELYRNSDGTWGAMDYIDVVFDGPRDTGAEFHHDDSIEIGPGGLSASTTTDVLIDGPRDTGAGFHHDAGVDLGRDGFSASTSTDAEIDGPGDTGAEFHSDAGVDFGDGDVLLDAGIAASATGPGGKEVGADGHLGYSTVTDEAGNVVTTAGVDGGVKAGDRGIEGSAGFEGTKSADGTRSSNVTGDVDVIGAAPGSLLGGAAAPAGNSAASNEDALVSEATNAVSDLAGTGDLSDALASGSASVEEVTQMVETEAFDDFTSDIVSTEITEAAAEEVWDDIGQ